MLFQAALTIPANTAATVPVTQLLGIGYGIITRVLVRPRPGHHALAHMLIKYHEHQIAPSTENMDFHGDTFPIDYDEHLEIFQPPFELKLVGWNDDDTYEHEFDVFIVILPRAAVISLAVMDAIKGILGMLSPRRLFGGG